MEEALYLSHLVSYKLEYVQIQKCNLTSPCFGEIPGQGSVAVPMETSPLACPPSKLPSPSSPPPPLLTPPQQTKINNPSDGVSTETNYNQKHKPLLRD